MIIRRIAALALASIALAGCATGGGTRNTAETAAYLAQDFTCTSAGSAAVELATLERAPERYADSCVRVLGFAKDDFLYQDAGSANAPAQRERLGVYWQDKALERRLRLGPSFVTLVARVRRCSRHVEAAPATAQEPCRSVGTALFVSEARIVPTAMD